DQVATDSEHGAGVQDRVDDRDAVDRRAVAAAEIADVDPAGLGDDLAVEPRHRAVVELQLRADLGADHHPRAARRRGAAGVGAGLDPELEALDQGVAARVGQELGASGIADHRGHVWTSSKGPPTNAPVSSASSTGAA